MDDPDSFWLDTESAVSLHNNHGTICQKTKKGTSFLKHKISQVLVVECHDPDYTWYLTLSSQIKKKERIITTNAHTHDPVYTRYLALF